MFPRFKHQRTVAGIRHLRLSVLAKIIITIGVSLLWTRIMWDFHSESLITPRESLLSILRRRLLTKRMVEDELHLRDILAVI